MDEEARKRKNKYYGVEDPPTFFISKDKITEDQLQKLVDKHDYGHPRSSCGRMLKGGWAVRIVGGCVRGECIDKDNDFNIKAFFEQVGISPKAIEWKD